MKSKKRQEEEENEVNFNSPEMFIVWVMVFMLAGLVVYALSLVISWFFSIPTVPFFYGGLIGFGTLGIIIIKKS